MIPRPYIYTFTMLLCTLIQISAQNLPKLPPALIDYMASRDMRLHHYLWHNVRNLWLILDEETRQAIRDLGWEPPRPALRWTEDGRRIVIVDNDSGEDFLYMHRQMVAVANQIISEQDEHYQKVRGFRSIPSPSSTAYPVPPAYETPDPDLTEDIITLKSDEFYNNRIKPQEDWFNNPDNLRRMTLGEFGANLEFTIHNWLHMRFSEEPIGFRPGTDVGAPDIDEEWDDPAYDWLGDTYSSQVNPWFWKIHGWVDDRIKVWQEANNVEEIEWKGTWVGGPTDSLPPVPSVEEESFDDPGFHDHPDLDDMEQVTQIVLATGMETNFFDQVQTPMDSLSFS